MDPIRHCTALTLPKIISSKSWLLKSWHMCRTHLIWKKKIDHLHQQSAILLHQAQTLGVLSIGKSGFWYWYPHFGFCNRTRNLNTDLPSSSYDQLLLPKSQTFTHSQVKGLATKYTNKQYLLLHFYKTLKKANLQINPSYAVGNEPVSP